MKNISLQGTWKVCYGQEEIEVQVPSALEKYIQKKDTFCQFHYQRTFTIARLEDKDYELCCEGISCFASVYINEQHVGDMEGIWQSHVLNIKDYIKDGENTIAVIIEKPSFDKADKFYYRSVLFGFIPDVLLPFSGIFKDIYITEKNSVHFKDIDIFFAYEHKQLVIESHTTKADCELEITYQVSETKHCVRVPYTTHVVIDLEELVVWSPAHPHLYKVRVCLLCGSKLCDEVHTTLGFRTIEIVKDEVLLNGEPTYFRGILHWGYYPEEMSVSPSLEQARRELEDIRAQGFDAIKFCLFIPPKHYLDLCDEMGILVWQEFPLWLPYDNGYLFDRIQKQYPEMMRICRSHASLFMISIGCELDATIPGDVLNQLYRDICSYKTMAIVCDNSGSGECYEGALHSESDIYDYHFYGEIHNMQTLIHEFKHSSRNPKPWFFGEFNDMDTFRDLADVRKKSAYELYWASAKEQENLLRYVHANAVSDMPIYEYERICKENELAKDMEQLLVCANRKAYDVRKYNLETTRKNNINGYSITALRDVPITSCGIFDDFGNKKWTDEQMQKINGEIVISMSAPLKRKWNHGADVFLALDEYNFHAQSHIQNRIHISNHGATSGVCTLQYFLQDGEHILYQKEENIVLQAHASKEYMQLDIPLPACTEVQQLTLGMKLVFNHTSMATNAWDIWVYPKETIAFDVYDPTGVLDGIEHVFAVRSIQDLEEVQASVLVTTVLNDCLIKHLPPTTAILYIQNGEGYFASIREPFWRECVRLVNQNSCLNELKTKGYDSLQFLSLTTDRGILPKDIYAKVPVYEQIMTRIDNRRFHRSECIFSFKKEGHTIIACTLQFGHCTGVQARSIKENIVAQNVLKAMVKELKK